MVTCRLLKEILGLEGFMRIQVALHDNGNKLGGMVGEDGTTNVHGGLVGLASGGEESSSGRTLEVVAGDTLTRE